MDANFSHESFDAKSIFHRSRPTMERDVFIPPAPKSLLNYTVQVVANMDALLSSYERKQVLVRSSRLDR